MLKNEHLTSLVEAQIATDKKSIFITGAASGIGKETAKFFAEKDWFVGLFDINANGLAELGRELPSENCVIGELDVCDREQWKQAIERFTAKTAGKMNVFLNNAGIGEGGDFEDVPEDVQQRIIDVNLVGVVNGLNAALPVLKASAPSKIINIASAAGIYGPPRLAVYGATKAAVLSLSESLEIELEKDGVGVSTIMPWYVDTPILDGAAYGTNRSAREELAKHKVNVYPVSMVSQAIWNAVGSNRQYHTVGREAAVYRFITGLLPSLTRRIYRKMYASSKDRMD